MCLCWFQKHKSGRGGGKGERCVWHPKVKIQMDFMFVRAEGTFVDEPRAKVTVLMVICKDDGNLSVTKLRSKTDEYGVEMVLRFLSARKSIEIKTDGEPRIVEIVGRVQARRDKTTTLAQTSGRHQEIGAVERANGTVQAQFQCITWMCKII